MTKLPMNDPQDASAETEDALVRRAQAAVNMCRWVVGECATQWTQRYARGRTDADFAALVGLSPDQVFQRRRVWETFHSVRERFVSLAWSHFYTALNWDDGIACLQWSEDTGSTVAEMRAWRRAQRGEDLSQPAEDESSEIPPFNYLPTDTEWVQAPGRAGPNEDRSGGARIRQRDADDAQAPAFARELEDGESYSPFRKGALSPAATAVEERPAAHAPPPSTEQLVKRLTASFERCIKVLTPEFKREFQELPTAVRERFLTSIQNIHAETSHLE